jgi:WS/DGAT/MGAT family acyltransferase
MSDIHENESLSFIDALFLYVEQPGAPVNVASVMAFEGLIPLDECMEYVESKLPQIPRFLQRPVTTPFCAGPPTWQYDPHFDVRHHVHEITLKRGTDTEWKAAVSAILSTHLDRSRPLWEITLLHGLKSQRTGVVVKVHHCMVDGVAGVAMLHVLLDPSSVAPPLYHKKPSFPAVPPPHDPGTALLDGLISTCFSTAQALLTAHSELLRLAQQATASRSETHANRTQSSIGALAQIAPLGNLANLLSELAQPTERLPFNVLCHGPQKFDWAEIPMAEIVAVKQACEATVNEVVLTVLSMALQRYAELHTLNVKGRKLRIVVPVNVRQNGDASVAGNQITFLPVDIPCSVREPRAFLSLVQERVKFSRTAHGAELVGLLGVLLGALPTTLQSLVGSVLSQLPISVCNSICTNVHGPKTPLYLLGHKMVSTYPYVPIGGEMGMNCAVMSYDGTLFVGFTGDAKAIPDLRQLAGFFAESFVELRDATGVHIPKKRRSRPKLNVAVRKTPKVPAAHAGAAPSSDAAPRGDTVVPRGEAVPSESSLSAVSA